MRIFLTILLLYSSITGYALSGEAYLQRFLNYLQWHEKLPEQPQADFYAFITDDTPLAKKLREQWLYHLAIHKDWTRYLKYYKNSDDINLQCYRLLANYHRGQIQEAFSGAKTLWLVAHSQPPACNQLFELLLKNPQFDETLLKQRIILALDKQNVSLARHLLKQYKPPRRQEADLLTDIYLNPSHILSLEPSDLHSYFYLYGLKRLVNINIKQAIHYWHSPQTKRHLSFAQQQDFLALLALRKAIHHDEDSQYWFAQVKPAYYTQELLDWQIRYALKQLQWKKVEFLIQQTPDKAQPCWQYWLARALEARGEKEQANTIYQTLAQTRHYYGFLASLRLKQKLAFKNESHPINLALLKPYQLITHSIQQLYQTKQQRKAANLLIDFMSELPKQDKATLLYWVTEVLKWPSQSIYLSNGQDLINQLALRFPLVHYKLIHQYAKHYQISKEFIYAIIRQESGFRTDVVSPAGAHGLMQVMPSTAHLVAKHEKIAYLHKSQLFVSQKNINIGVAYLKHLANHFKQHPILIAAAYNAGPHQVSYWLKNHSPKQIDIWIETLPWHETRNYLKNIIAFAAVYQYRMQAKPDLSEFMEPLNS